MTDTPIPREAVDAAVCRVCGDPAESGRDVCDADFHDESDNSWRTPADRAQTTEGPAMTEHTDTPPVAGETTDAAVTAAARAWTNAVADPILHDLWPTLTPIQQRLRLRRARNAIAAALPHLTAERDAETTALRAELESERKTSAALKTHLVSEQNRLRGHLRTAWDRFSAARTEVDNLRTRDAAWKAYTADLAQLITAIGFDAWRGVDKGHDVLDDIYQATVVPPLPAVLADPAPSTPEGDQAP